MKFDNPSYQETFYFVRQHPDAVLESIPDHLLDLWSVKDDGNIDRYYQLFTIIHLARKRESAPMNIGVNQLKEQFYNFQILLQLESLIRGYAIDVQKEEIKIFDFDNYNKEQISIAEDIIHLSNQLQTT
ncbi:hypothetical protein D0T84_18595 [Dysgonomonas sp. 521]|uniref:hypothetical protein n=1 Tax=Dysgonomonas sp. 521 TaxID=2302932 RepID=UPI0013D1CBB6|nr:hypothetical protein [Dysgonomonas sp. 521]NDV96900.1 hypothetical protein [Dysgonomonas sp. 521]